MSEVELSDPQPGGEEQGEAQMLESGRHRRRPSPEALQGIKRTQRIRLITAFTTGLIGALLTTGIVMRRYAGEDQSDPLSVLLGITVTVIAGTFLISFDQYLKTRSRQQNHSL